MILTKEKETDELLDKIEALNGKLEEIKTKISEARKSGKDLLMADMHLRTAKSKIEYFRVTRTEEDHKQVLKMFEMAEAEIKEAVEDETKDFKTQVRENLVKEGLAEEINKED